MPDVVSVLQVSIGQIYRLTILFGLGGTVSMLFRSGWRVGLAFLVGSALSLGNLWVFDRLAKGLEPGLQVIEGEETKPKRGWQASTFVSRYLIFLAAGYVTVNALGVSPLPVVLGLFASTAAVLLSSLLELAGSLMGRRGA